MARRKKAGLSARTLSLLIAAFAAVTLWLSWATPSEPSGSRDQAHPKGEMILPAAGYETRDVSHRFIISAFALLVSSLAVITLCVLWILPLPTTDRTLHTPLPVYPEPRLQPSPRQEMARFLESEMAQLTSYGWVDKAHGIVHLPIDVAMDKVAHRGIPDWPTPSQQPTKPSLPVRTTSTAATQ